MAMRMLRPDAKGRIALGKLAMGVSGFVVTTTADHKIILEPYSEVPAREKWLFNNAVASAKLKQGLQDAAEGRLVDKGSFSQFIDEDE